jgi:hypothetical protein
MGFSNRPDLFCSVIILFLLVSYDYEHSKSCCYILIFLFIFVCLGKPTAVLSDYDDYLSPSEFDTGDSSSGHREKAKMIRSDSDAASSTDSILEEEEREEGSVQMNVYLSYLRAVGYLLSGAILLSMLLMQSSRNITDWWLSYWVSTVYRIEITDKWFVLNFTTFIAQSLTT